MAATICIDHLEDRDELTPSPYLRRRLAVLVVLIAGLALTLQAASLWAGRDGASVRTAEPAGEVVVSNPAAYGAAGLDPPAGAVYVVQPGDSLWSIAAALDPAADVRAAVDRLAKLNGGAAIEAGQRLRLQ